MLEEKPAAPGILRAAACIAAATLGPAAGVGIVLPRSWLEPAFWVAVVLQGSLIGTVVGLAVWAGSAWMGKESRRPPDPDVWKDDFLRLFCITGGLGLIAGLALHRMSG